MANTITPYNPIWYAQRAIERLERILTFAPLAFRAYEQEPRRRGDTIQVKKPGGFTAQSMPITTAADLTPSKFDITLDKWWGVAFKLDDKELAYTGEEIIRDHIDPAMHALSQKIEDTLFALYADIPWYVEHDGTNPENDFVDGRKLLNENNVPFSNRGYIFGPIYEASYLKTALFHQANTAGDGGATQREGFLGRKFGFENYTSNGTPNHTKGALVGSPITNGQILINATSVVLDAGSLTGDVNAGDSFVFAGHTQRYAVTADATAAGNAITVAFTPPLAVASVADGTAATFYQETTTSIGLQFHREAFALVMAPLSDAGNARGADVGTAIDPASGLTLRASRWYEPKDAEHWMRFDALWGTKTLDSNKAVRIEVTP